MSSKGWKMRLSIGKRGASVDLHRKNVLSGCGKRGKGKDLLKKEKRTQGKGGKTRKKQKGQNRITCKDGPA